MSLFQNEQKVPQLKIEGPFSNYSHHSLSTELPPTLDN